MVGSALCTTSQISLCAAQRGGSRGSTCGAVPLAQRRPARPSRRVNAASSTAGAARAARLGCRASSETAAPAAAVQSREGDVLAALSRIIDPDFGMNIVDCGFVKDLAIDAGAGSVSFRLELTTPACPIKDEFERQARDNVSALPWVTSVDVRMDARPPAPLLPDEDRPNGLRSVSHIIAVSSCKGGVGKSTTAVNLAFTLAQMGAKVGIFDADVYGPSLPTMISPELRVLQMDPETKAITPVEYEGVKAVSFGYAGQGSAIMRGPMVSGLIQQLLTTTDWGELDYLIVDFPPGTGDIQLTLCQSVSFSAAVIVTTPQKLAFIDVAKGIRMFAKLMVPCVAVVENMSYFDAEGKRFFPFGQGSGDRIVGEFGLPNLVRFPIVPDLSAAGDSGRPVVVSDPTGPTAQAFLELGAAVVREVAKLRRAPKNSVRYDAELGAFVVKLPNGEEEFLLDPATVRRNDTSAKSINEWTGERTLRDSDIPDDIEPAAWQPVGNYAVQISWQDGFSQIAPFDLLDALPRLSAEDAQARQAMRARLAAAKAAAAGGGGPSAAQQILQTAQTAQQ
ncbi:fe-S cluster assembly factor chloroplastic [Micractinium conductrix]|uniref:Fe-S cluster assembly factor chloroplastic n=1 Tax=Micractinium conductrix TaxID=554055 RepID=A0A2P6VLK5_9CHLO|nr:fe-S cluster assembly factor chloroplastic [Micractinium conductrix]|eukprot:PSC74969.1 fe-S cluster assembly factor chloroplastic [Micractinium conductrix]